MRRIIIGLLLFSGVVMNMPAASAATGVNIRVTSSSEGPCVAGSREFTIHANVTVTNDSAIPQTLGAVTYESLPGSPTVNVVDDGGLGAGTVIPPATANTYVVKLTVSVPCGQQWATVVVSVPFTGLATTFVDGDDFLSSGTPVSIGAIGGGILAVALGAALFARQRRHERILSAA